MYVLIIKLIQTIFCFICFIFYSICLFVIQRKTSTLTSTYFKLCFSLGIADLITAINEKIIDIDLYPIILNIIPFLSNTLFFNQFLSWYFLLCQCFGLILITINRYMAIVDPLQFALVIFLT